MRRALPTLAILCLTLAVAAVWLFTWARELYIVVDGTHLFPGQLAAALGAVAVLATVVVGLMAMARRRHWGWLSALIVAGLLSVVGSSIALVAIPPWMYFATDLDPCPSFMKCAPPPPYWLPMPFLAAPVVVGLVVLVYRFQMRPPFCASEVARRGRAEFEQRTASRHPAAGPRPAFSAWECPAWPTTQRRGW
jgi:hypothetical protein